MPQTFQGVAVLRAIVDITFLDAGIKQGDVFYLVRDSQSHHFCAVRWDRIHWQCSCDKGACAHKLAVNDFVFEESQKRRITDDDLAAHVEDGLNR